MVTLDRRVGSAAQMMVQRLRGFVPALLVDLRAMSLIMH